MSSAAGTGSNFLPNNGRVLQNGGVRILCVADVRGKFRCISMKSYEQALMHLERQPEILERPRPASKCELHYPYR